MSEKEIPVIHFKNTPETPEKEARQLTHRGAETLARLEAILTVANSSFPSFAVTAKAERNDLNEEIHALVPELRRTHLRLQQALSALTYNKFHFTPYKVVNKNVAYTKETLEKWRQNLEEGKNILQEIDEHLMNYPDLPLESP